MGLGAKEVTFKHSIIPGKPFFLEFGSRFAYDKSIPENVKTDGISMRKRRLAFVILAGIFCAVTLFIGYCYHLCPSTSPGFLQHPTCSLLSHSFSHSPAWLSPLFILPLMGLFLLINYTSIPEGFFLPPLKPPRFYR